MKTRSFVLVVVLLLTTNSLSIADGQLKKNEILEIFQTLTQQPRKTWISSGAITAMHQEYRAADTYTADSTVTIKYDGQRFRWEIDTDSSDSQPAPPTNIQNEDMYRNKKRIFSWDGQRYTVYFRPGNHAIVNESPTTIPVAVNGPLTAGIVPWGYGVYTYDNLANTDSSAEVDSLGLVNLTIQMQTNRLALQMLFVLDPTKDYAVLSYSLSDGGISSIQKTYEDYTLIGGKWVPTSITIESYDERKEPSELVSYDYWNLSSVNAGPASPNSFTVDYESGALVTYNSSVDNISLRYRHSTEVDTKRLLEDRLAAASVTGGPNRNCATVAMKYVAEHLGKNVPDANLAELITEPDNGTTLYGLRQFANELGFYCLAGKTNIETLRNLQDCKVILHLPGPKHYVVLEYVDDEHVWITDLDSNRFLYRTAFDDLHLDWSSGTALLISDAPINLQGGFTEVSDDELETIVGGFPKYSCTNLLQAFDIQFCSEPIGLLCGGRYQVWFNVFGCEEDENGGSCVGTSIFATKSSPCILDPQTLDSCEVTGIWDPEYLRGCSNTPQ